MAELNPGVRALTLVQPWASCITHGGKRIENRTWAPPAALIGERILIHAGAKFDEDAALDLDTEVYAGKLAVPSWVTDEVLAPRRAIVGVARLIGIVTASAHGHGTGLSARAKEVARESACWFTGPFGWVLDEVLAFKVTVMCRGAQGLWTPPPEVVAQVNVRLAEEATHG